ncbi:MAG: hypothetical protein R3343_12375 [Nitriliruptorales bacterium]|nr:hypothetical protein [Nitriliruptorales bacterium]
MTNALYVTTLVAVGVLIVAVAVTLLTVTYLLWRTRSTLADVGDAISTIADRTEPLGPALAAVNEDLLAVRNALVDALPVPPDASDATAQRSELTGSES